MAKNLFAKHGERLLYTSFRPYFAVCELCKAGFRNKNNIFNKKRNIT